MLERIVKEHFDKTNTNTNYFSKCTKKKDPTLPRNQEREEVTRKRSMPFTTARLTTGPWE